MQKRSVYYNALALIACSLLITQSGLAQKTAVPAGKNSSGHSLNITSFGDLKSWTGTTDPLGKNTNYNSFNRSDSADIGVFWWDARDIERIEVAYHSLVGQTGTDFPVIQYWHSTWPETPPKMPTKEDLEDDAWQGRWLAAATDVKVNANTLVYSFQPMTAAENANAIHLPGSITYRRTMKIRLVYPGKHLPVKSLQVFSASKEKSRSVRMEWTDSTKKNTSLAGTFEIFNGRLKTFSAWRWNKKDKKTGPQSFKINLNGSPKGIVADLYSAAETLPGSNDETVVTFRSPQGTFSFSLNDVDKGPVYIPHFNVYITASADQVSFSRARVVKGKTIRERIPEQPEQTYDRARSEIPALDPTSRSGGGSIDLPLAADASWQKFGIQWGGNIMIDKDQVKAQGRERARCNWDGNSIRWSLGAGLDPDYKRTRENCRMSLLNDYLPVYLSSWNHEGLNYQEEAFATLLRGPLSPDDANRNEQTPAILMVKLVISNPSLSADTAHLWLSGNKGLSGLEKEGDFLMDQVAGKNYIRCYMPSPAGGEEKPVLIRDTAGVYRKVHRQFYLEPNSSRTLYFYFPFVGDLTAASQKEIASLDYPSLRQHITSYWRNIVEKTSVYNVPERKFNEMGKAVIPHIRMNVTKDPQSGLFMTPAAGFTYFVYPNEAVFQTLLLDRLGDFNTSANYLNTFMALQGSVKLPGTFTGDQKDVFFGIRQDSIYDMTDGNGYNMHHGAVLWGLARHYLYSGDKQWLVKAAPQMIRAAKWIIEQRGNTKLLDEQGNKVMHYGLLPAGSLEDPHDWQFWYATNAYACMGMEAMARAFAKAGLPEANLFKQAAKEYHDDIRTSIDRASERSPVVRLRNNTYAPYVPTRPYQRFRYFGSKKAEYYDRYQKSIYPALRLSATREALYGPIVLLKAGLVEADEPMADWILDDWEDNLTLSTSLNLNVHGRVDDEYWFSRGGMVFQANLQNPVGIYLLRKEIPATLRGLYDNFVSCLYPDINAQTEEYREWGHGSGPFYKSPDEARFVSQVCDLLVLENKEELWLAAGTPRRWLEAGQHIALTKAATEYGDISYTLKPGSLPETIEANIQLPKEACAKVLLYVRAPFQKPIKKVLINGQEWKDWDATKEAIVIPQTVKKVLVTVSY